MKPFILSLLLAVSAYGQLAPWGIPQTYVPPAASGSACGVLVCEDFEDATTGYDSANANHWATNSGTAINPKYTTSPAPLVGTQSLFVNNAGSSATVNIPFTAQSELYLYFEYSESTGWAGAEHVFNFSTSGGTEVIRCDTGPATISTTSGSTTFVRGTHYYFWFHYKAGSGANGVFEIYSSITSTKPGSPGTSTSSGAWTSSIGMLKLGLDTGGNSLIFDKIRISTSDIGSNPP